MGAAEGGFFLTWCFISEYSYSWPHLFFFFFKILRVSIIKKYREFIMSFSSAVRRSCIPSVVVWFLDLLQRHFFFLKMHVMFMFCCGVGGGGDNSRQVFNSFTGICQLTVQTPQDPNDFFFSLATYYDINWLFNFHLVAVTMAEARSISVCFVIRYWGKFAICCLVYLGVVMLQYFVPLSQVPLTLICYQSCHKSLLNVMWPYFFLGFFFPLSIPVSSL